jgi:exosortase E/protease (VPEID-CTERM system)
LGLVSRALLFLLLFCLEWIPVSMAVHKGRGAGVLLQIVLVFCSVYLSLSYVKAKGPLQEFSRELRRIPLDWVYLVWHLAAFLVFLALSFLPDPPGVFSPLRSGIWYLSGFLAIALAGRAFLPPGTALRLVHGTGHALIYSLLTAVSARALVSYWQFGTQAVWDPAAGFYWKPVRDLTFGLVKALLSLVLPHVFADRATMRIGTADFRVIIAPWCTGFEGAVLILLFTAAWLWFFRKEFRFPRALLLAPAGLAVIWLCNGVRIAVLILIGVAGYPAVAMGGFHSQAGWIAFNCVALGFAILSQRILWFRSPAFRPFSVAATVEEKSGPNPTVAYLMPFVAILAAGMLSGLASGGFEWFYPVRVVAALIALWFFRAKYAQLDWGVGWLSGLQSTAAGCAVFAIWLAMDRFTGANTASAIGPGLAAWPAAARIAWLVLRTVGAVITVPIAEELAFRGFLIRRLMTADFESLPPRVFSYIAVSVSALAFGLMHGERWLAGMLAGLIYTVVYLRRGRIGDAVLAHATTNALLACCVLLGGKWYLW